MSKAGRKISNFFKTAFSFIARPFAALGNRLKSKVLLKKILYTLLLLLIFRIAATITTPGIIVNVNFGDDQSSFIGILNLMGGGALRNFSLVALGISPYITSSIIMTLLQSEVFPPIYRLSQSGQAGRRKINIITRVMTLVFAYVQALTITQQFSLGQDALVSLIPELDNIWFIFFGLPLILMAGSLFTLFLSEQITSNGVGNGTSLIIFSGIAVDLPGKFRNAYFELFGSPTSEGAFLGIMNFSLYIIVFLALIYIIGYFYKAERHLPIQQTGSGLTRDVKQMSRLPIKLNPAGVMPVIFALTISVLPLTIIQFFHHQNVFRIWIENNLTLTDPLGLIMFVAVIFMFSIVMSLVTFNPQKVSDNFKKGGTFIPGLRPGRETEDYLTAIVIRLSLFSAIYLSAISALEYIQQIIGLSSSISFGGTSMIILVTVAIETFDQLKARDQTQKISKAKLKVKTTDGKVSDSEGLLW